MIVGCEIDPCARICKCLQRIAVVDRCAHSSVGPGNAVRRANPHVPAHVREARNELAESIEPVANDADIAATALHHLRTVIACRNVAQSRTLREHVVIEQQQEREEEQQRNQQHADIEPPEVTSRNRADLALGNFCRFDPCCFPEPGHQNLPCRRMKNPRVEKSYSTYSLSDTSEKL